MIFEPIALLCGNGYGNLCEFGRGHWQPITHIRQNIFRHPTRELSDSAYLLGSDLSRLVMQISIDTIAFAVRWLL